MDVKKLTDTLFVTGQISPDEVGELAAQGFQSIICNRPNDEEQGQPGFAEIADAATAHGMAARHIPVDSDRPVDMQKDEFARALAEMPGPVLAYCRTGNRGSMLHEAIGG
ncbi:MAG: TIGR01244 family sulfur transferase [Alteraurantiacibacter sp.]